jgi:asparagine synthetase A
MAIFGCTKAAGSGFENSPMHPAVVLILLTRVKLSGNGDNHNIPAVQTLLCAPWPPTIGSGRGNSGVRAPQAG